MKPLKEIACHIFLFIGLLYLAYLAALFLFETPMKSINLIHGTIKDGAHDIASAGIAMKILYSLLYLALIIWGIVFIYYMFMGLMALEKKWQKKGLIAEDEREWFPR